MTTADGGVTVGDDADAATAAFQAAGLDVDLDTSQEDVFGAWFLRVTDAGQPAYEASIDPENNAITSLGAPTLFACE